MAGLRWANPGSMNCLSSGSANESTSKEVTMSRSPKYFIGFTVICLLFAVPFAAAQDRGTITGTVTDSSGAAVPGASVILRHPDTGLSQSTVSGGEGGFSFIYLSAGKYTVTVEMPGFRKAEIADVRVSVNTATR